MQCLNESDNSEEPEYSIHRPDQTNNQTLKLSISRDPASDSWNSEFWSFRVPEYLQSTRGFRVPGDLGIPEVHNFGLTVVLGPIQWFRDTGIPEFLKSISGFRNAGVYFEIWNSGIVELPESIRRLGILWFSGIPKILELKPGTLHSGIPESPISALKINL